MFVYLCDDLNGHSYVISSYFDSYSLELSINGRSRGNVVQARAETSSLLECYAESSRHSWNKIQKLRKFRASEYRVKFTWTMLSAAEILYQKKRPIIAHIILLIFRKPHLKMPGKNYKKFAWVDWKNYYLHRRKLQKSFLYSWLKQLSCNFFLVPLGAFHVSAF